jgi:hypothetical protein
MPWRVIPTFAQQLDLISSPDGLERGISSSEEMRIAEPCIGGRAGISGGVECPQCSQNLVSACLSLVLENQGGGGIIVKVEKRMKIINKGSNRDYNRDNYKVLIIYNLLNKLEEREFFYQRSYDQRSCYR